MSRKGESGEFVGDVEVDWIHEMTSNEYNYCDQVSISVQTILYISFPQSHFIELSFHFVFISLCSFQIHSIRLTDGFHLTLLLKRNRVYPYHEPLDSFFKGAFLKTGRVEKVVSVGIRLRWNNTIVWNP